MTSSTFAPLLPVMCSGEMPGLGIFGFFYCEPSEFDGHICGFAVDLTLGKGPLGEQRPVPVLESFLANLGNHLNRMKQRKACDFVLCDMVIRDNSV